MVTNQAINSENNFILTFMLHACTYNLQYASHIPPVTMYTSKLVDGPSPVDVAAVNETEYTPNSFRSARISFSAVIVLMTVTYL